MCRGESTQARSCLFSNANESPGKAQSTPAAAAPQQSPPAAPQQAPVPSEWRQWSSWSDCNSVPLSAEPPFRSRWRECNPCSTDTTVQCLPCQGASFEQMACQKPAPNTNYINPNLNGEQPFWAASPNGNPSQPSDHQPSNHPAVVSGVNGVGGANVLLVVAPTLGDTGQEDELCAGLPQCNAPPTVLTVSPGGEVPMQDQPAKQQVLLVSYPCSLCPPQYPLPCYTCIALPNPQAGKKKKK
uniref:Uncharacterized protein n=1 Tax=Ditylenchus dipsaci TaxID=166011 RepID=A0A915DU59_9BILA